MMQKPVHSLCGLRSLIVVLSIVDRFEVIRTDDQKVVFSGPLAQDDPVRGFYRRTASDSEPYRDIYHGCWHLFGPCDLVELFPDRAEAGTW